MTKYIVTNKFRIRRNDVDITFYKNQEWYADAYEVDELNIGYSRLTVRYDELKYYDDYDIIEADNEARTAFIEVKKTMIEIKRSNITLFIDAESFKNNFKEMN